MLGTFEEAKTRITTNSHKSKVDRKKTKIMKRIIEEFGEGEEDDEKKK